MTFDSAVLPNEICKDERESFIVDCLVDAFSDLMAADPDAFRTKFRKMAADPFAFYRGSACLFYADVSDREDRWADERTSRVWIQGDLHAENFGTYMDGSGVLIFDVNDFDEAFVGHFTWDLQRFAASVALMCWQKALSDEAITKLIETFARAYVGRSGGSSRSRTTPPSRSTSRPPAEPCSRRCSRPGSRRARRCSTTSPSSTSVTGASASCPVSCDSTTTSGRRWRRRSRRYLDTIPKTQRFRGIAYDVKDVIGKTGFGIGSAGLPSYTVLIEGFNQALDNDVVLSMKQGNVAARAGWSTTVKCTSTSSITDIGLRSRSGHCRRTPTPCSVTPTSTGSASWSANSRRMRPIWTGAS